MTIFHVIKYGRSPLSSNYAKSYEYLCSLPSDVLKKWIWALTDKFRDGYYFQITEEECENIRRDIHLKSPIHAAASVYDKLTMYTEFERANKIMNACLEYYIGPL
jgi:hypothetical protein